MTRGSAIINTCQQTTTRASTGCPRPGPHPGPPPQSAAAGPRCCSPSRFRYRPNWGLPGYRHRPGRSPGPVLLSRHARTRPQCPRRHHSADRRAHGRVAPARRGDTPRMFEGPESAATRSSAGLKTLTSRFQAPTKTGSAPGPTPTTTLPREYLHYPAPQGRPLFPRYL